MNEGKRQPGIDGGETPMRMYELWKLAKHNGEPSRLAGLGLTPHPSTGPPSEARRPPAEWESLLRK